MAKSIIHWTPELETMQVETIETLVQDDPDTGSWVGQPGSQKFLTTPIVGGYRLDGLANGPQGVYKNRIGKDKPIYVVKCQCVDETRGGIYGPRQVVWCASLSDPRKDRNPILEPIPDEISDRWLI